MEKHVHCANCNEAIATRVKDAGGFKRDAEIAVGYQWRLGTDDAGVVGPVQVKVPLCSECHVVVDAEDAKRKEAAARLAAASRLVIAPAGSIPQAPV